jgi:hypothetical protein
MGELESDFFGKFFQVEWCILWRTRPHLAGKIVPTPRNPWRAAQKHPSLCFQKPGIDTVTKGHSGPGRMRLSISQTRQMVRSPAFIIGFQRPVTILPRK